MARAKNQFICKNNESGVEMWLKREDQLHPEYSGNKFRKLKYNLEEARKKGYVKILTFGGAYSNHIAATAAAGKKHGFSTIGIIRGEELGKNLTKTLKNNPSLANAHRNGMQFYFIPRKTYREKHTEAFQEELKSKFGKFYSLPEGGTNRLAVRGCAEILTEEDKKFDCICCPVGTGGTLAGLINAALPHQTVFGFSALKADLSENVRPFVKKENWHIFPEESFGGYAKINLELVRFINAFKQKYHVPLDPIYTGKMLFSLLEKMKTADFQKNTRILAIHTGGLQGISGMNKKLTKKGWPTINV